MLEWVLLIMIGGTSQQIIMADLNACQNALKEIPNLSSNTWAKTDLRDYSAFCINTKTGEIIKHKD